MIDYWGYHILRPSDGDDYELWYVGSHGAHFAELIGPKSAERYLKIGRRHPIQRWATTGWYRWIEV